MIRQLFRLSLLLIISNLFPRLIFGFLFSCSKYLCYFRIKNAISTGTIVLNIQRSLKISLARDAAFVTSLYIVTTVKADALAARWCDNATSSSFHVFRLA